MSKKKSTLDEYRQQTSMSQKIANKKGYKQMVEYIGDFETSKKVAKLNVMIKLGLIENDEVTQYMKARLIEEGLAFFMTNIANEVTNLGMIIGDNRKRSSGSKPSK